MSRRRAAWTSTQHVEAFRPYADAGFDEVYISNMGPHHRMFFDLYRDEVLPRVR